MTECHNLRAEFDLATRLLSSDLPVPNPYLTGTLADGIYQLRAELERERGETQRLRTETDYLREQWKKTAGELERVQKRVAAMREAMQYAQGRVAFILRDVQEVLQAALSADAGSGYKSPAEIRELVKPLVEAAQLLAERAPQSPYPKEWDTDPGFIKHVPYCEVIALRKALEHVKEKGLA